MFLDLVGEGPFGGAFEEYVVELLAVLDGVIVAETLDDVRGRAKAIEYLLFVLERTRVVGIRGFDGDGRREPSGAVCWDDDVDGGEGSTAE